MAGYKETPRQKMIAMMYLVLTALLALNVSKEILDAFLVVNDSIETTNEKFERKIDETYQKFEQQYELNQEKVSDEWEEAIRVREITNRMVNYVDSLKHEVISFTEGITFQEAKTVELVNVKKKDNYDAPTNFFVGSDTKKGAGFELKDSIDWYRERMLKFIDEKDREVFDNRFGLKTDGDYKNATGQSLDWVHYNFYHTILAADVTILNKVKAEIFNTESDVISHLYSSITEEDFKFSGLSAKVIPKSSYVFKGDDYEAEILVAAVDETQNPVVYIRHNADTMTRDMIPNASEIIEGNKGSAKLVLPATAEGTKKYAGLIEMTNPAGDKNYYHFKEDFIVARPSATISPTKMNVFYRGVDNPVSISASGKADSQLDVSITSGNLSRTDTGWVVNNLPPEAYETTIKVYADDIAGKKFMGEHDFRIKRLPDPIAKVYGADSDNKIEKKWLLANAFIVCTMPEGFDFEYKFKVNSFTMIVPTRGEYVKTEKSESNTFTDKMKSVIESLDKDDIIIFQEIKVRGPEGPRQINPLNITLK